MRFPHPVLVCDVGGTNVRIAACDRPGQTPRLILKDQTSAFSDLGAAVEAATSRAGVSARSLVVCAAGPIEGATVRLTNASWTISGPALAERLGLAQGLLLNDFEAQAIALPHIRETATRVISTGKPLAGAAQLVLGPGTGLGAAALMQARAAWLPATTEAGHACFGPAAPDEERIWPHLERISGRVTFESVLSGPGLARLHAALRAAKGLCLAPLAEDEIAAAARSGDAVADETLRLFWRLVARCASDLALIFMARGGVTLAGGVLPRFIDWLDAGAFRRAFADKAPLAALVADIPVRLLMDSDAVLAGLAALATAPETYALDYERRAWRPL